MLKRAAKPTLKALLLANGARRELNVPERGGQRRRSPAAHRHRLKAER
jgi:hypothetical protein